MADSTLADTVKKSPKNPGKAAFLSGLGALAAIYIKFQSAILAALKAGGLVKFAWIFKSFWTMFLSLALYVIVFGWRFGVVLIVLLLVHEGGHWIWMKAYGLEPKAPVFLPFVGAYVAMTKLPADEATHAWIAYAGPLIGGLASLAIYLAGYFTNTPWLMAAANVGFLLNLFQLIPAKPLDGGFIVGAISKWLLLAGAAVLVVLMFLLQSIMLAVITGLSIRSVIDQFSSKRQQLQPLQVISGQEGATVKELEEKMVKPEPTTPEVPHLRTELPAKPWQKVVIGLAYIGLSASLGFLYAISINQTLARSGLAHKMSQSPKTAIKEMFQGNNANLPE